MRLFDFFKKKKKKIKKPALAKAPAGKEREKPKAEVRKPKKKRVPGLAFKVLVTPHVTEKGTAMEKDNKYLFKVFPKTNKIEIKKAIEGLYGVDVIGVRIINIKRRQRRFGRQRGWKKGYKKAIVRIKKGQKIEILPR